MSLSLLMWAVAAMGVWLIVGVVAGLPDNDALRGVGSMARATTVLDASGATAFTISRNSGSKFRCRVSRHI